MFNSPSGCSLALLLVVATAAALLLNAGSTLAGSSNMDSVKPELSEGSGKGSGSANANFYANGSPRRRSSRSIYGFGPKMLQISRSKIPIELDLLVDNEDADRSKRTFDDYGHMRFGKRGGEEQFDDYGHMRFGRRR